MDEARRFEGSGRDWRLHQQIQIVRLAVLVLNCSTAQSNHFSWVLGGSGAIAAAAPALQRQQGGGRAHRGNVVTMPELCVAKGCIRG